MVLFLGALLGFGSSIASSAMNIREAKRNRDWQERMSNTAYQRGMKDMRLAGLNPILAYQKGGASSPGGAQAVVSDPGPSAIAGLKAKQELNNMKQVEHKDEALKDQADSQISLNQALEAKAKVERIQHANSALSIDIQNRKDVEGIPAARAQGAFDKTELGGAMRVINRVMRSMFGNDQTSSRN